MPKRWSKLKAQATDLFAEGLRLQLQCAEIRRNWNNDGSLPVELGTFTVRLGKLVIWNFPKQFVTYSTSYPNGGNQYSYRVSDINQLIREYLDTPRDELLNRNFESDHFGICDVLRAADRRLSVPRLVQYYTRRDMSFVNAILEARQRPNPAVDSDVPGTSGLRLSRSGGTPVT